MERNLDIEGFLSAIRERDVAAVNAYIACGIDLDLEFDPHGYTPLFEAIELGYEDIVRILVDAGANIEATSDEGTTALLKAAFCDNAALASYFIERGADLNARGSEGDIPLQVAAENGNHTLVKILLDSGADPTQSGNRGMHALNMAAVECHVECVRELLDHGVDPNLPDIDYTTALNLMYSSAFNWEAASAETQAKRQEIIRMLTQST